MARARAGPPGKMVKKEDLEGESADNSDVESDGYEPENKLEVEVGGAGPASNTFGRWSPGEDEALREAVSTLGARNWKRIAVEFLKDKRTDVQCLHRWQKVLRPGLIKGPWTQSEDATIKACIVQGVTRWSEIAKRVDGRIGKQCRERWHNHLDPGITRGEWTEHEDQQLILGQRTLGNKWSRIAKEYLPGRPENAVKNRWNAATRKRRGDNWDPSAAPVGSAALIEAASRAAAAEKAQYRATMGKKSARAEGEGGEAPASASGEQGAADAADALAVLTGLAAAELTNAKRSTSKETAKEAQTAAKEAAKEVRIAAKEAVKEAKKLAKKMAAADDVGGKAKAAGGSGSGSGSGSSKKSAASKRNFSALGAAALLAAAGELAAASDAADVESALAAKRQRGSGLAVLRNSSSRPPSIETMVAAGAGNLTTPAGWVPTSKAISPSKKQLDSKEGVEELAEELAASNAISALQFLASAVVVGRDTAAKAASAGASAAVRAALAIAGQAAPSFSST